jgi:hypothetical protein
MKWKATRMLPRLALNVTKLFVLASFLAFVVVPFSCSLFLNADYLHFKYRNAKYHASFAEACDLLLTQHPLGTNKVITLSVADPSLPAIISALHPQKIGLAPNKVWIGVHDGHIGGLAIIWEPQWEPQNQTQTNTWNLFITSGEGPEEVVYVGTRK